MSHFTVKCNEHDLRITGCKCGGQPRMITYEPCPDGLRERHEAKVKPMTREEIRTLVFDFMEMPKTSQIDIVEKMGYPSLAGNMWGDHDRFKVARTWFFIAVRENKEQKKLRRVTPERKR